jgi:hypothetical protein
MVVTIVVRKVEANGRHCCGEEIEDECCGVCTWILAGQVCFWCASKAAALALGCSVGVCNKKQLYALVDAEARIFLIYSLF